MSSCRATNAKLIYSRGPTSVAPSITVDGVTYSTGDIRIMRDAARDAEQRVNNAPVGHVHTLRLVAHDDAWYECACGARFDDVLGREPRADYPTSKPVDLAPGTRHMNYQPLKVYVAGASVERRERAIPAIQFLREAGIVITHDWTAEMEQYTSPEHSDADVPEDIRRRAAELDANGVRLADFVLLLAPNERGSSGVWVELGLAIAHRVPVVVAGAKARRTIFTSLAHRIYEDDVSAAAYLRAIHAERVT